MLLMDRQSYGNIIRHLRFVVKRNIFGGYNLLPLHEASSR